jgi:cellulose biosynthesis protein BcsQ
MNFSPVSSVVRGTSSHNLSLVAAHIRLSGMDLELAQAIDTRSKRPKRAPGAAKDRFDHVIIEAPPSPGILAINASVSSNRLLLTMMLIDERLIPYRNLSVLR